jgi:hypothetical protein
MMWPVVAVAIFGTILDSRLKRLQRVEPAPLWQQRAWSSGFAASTEADRFVIDQLSPMLAEGERIQHVGYVVEGLPESGGTAGLIQAARARGWYLALTDCRLLMIKTRVGAFRPLLENHGVEEIPRASVVALQTSGVFSTRKVVLSLQDGSVRTFQLKLSDGPLSGQRRFFEQGLPLLAARAR